MADDSTDHEASPINTTPETHQHTASPTLSNNSSSRAIANGQTSKAAAGAADLCRSPSIEIEVDVLSKQQRQRLFVEQLRRRVANGQYTLGWPRRRASSVWNVYKLIFDAEGVRTNYVYCEKCTHIAHVGERTFTSSLKNHACHRKWVQQQQSSTKTEMPDDSDNSLLPLDLIMPDPEACDEERQRVVESLRRCFQMMPQNSASSTLSFRCRKCDDVLEMLALDCVADRLAEHKCADVKPTIGGSSRKRRAAGSGQELSRTKRRQEIRHISGDSSSTTDERCDVTRRPCFIVLQSGPVVGDAGLFMPSSFDASTHSLLSLPTPAQEDQEECSSLRRLRAICEHDCTLLAASRAANGEPDVRYAVPMAAVSALNRVATLGFHVVAQSAAPASSGTCWTLSAE